MWRKKLFIVVNAMNSLLTVMTIECIGKRSISTHTYIEMDSITKEQKEIL
jgi:hypothetical protein